MKDFTPSWPLDEEDHLADALREQGEPAEAILEFSRSLMQLTEWQAPVPAQEDTRQLIERLTSYMPVREASPVRQAVRARPVGLAGEFVALLRLARAQVSIFQSSFWLASSVIVLIGGALILIGPVLNPTFLLQVIGPLLSYLGTAAAFRGNGLHMLEFELACPPSPRQLTLARLVIVLCYDIALGLLLSLLLALTAGFSFWPITLHWLAPLLLGAGLTLLLSLRMPVSQAAAISYVGWLALLVSALISQNGVHGSVSVFTGPTEVGFGLAGLALLGGVILWLPRAVQRMLPC
jgi:hypothetical protein